MLLFAGGNGQTGKILSLYDWKETTMVRLLANEAVFFHLIFIVSGCLCFPFFHSVVSTNILVASSMINSRGGGGVHNMLRVRICAAHMGGFLGPRFSKQGSLFRQISLKQG